MNRSLQQNRNGKDKSKLINNKWLNEYILFIRNTNFDENEYARVYKKIITNFANHLDYDIKKRMFNLSKFAYNKVLINKPFLNNIINCSVTNVKGFYMKGTLKVFLIETRVKSNGKEYSEDISVNEKILYRKKRQSYVIATEIERDTKL